MDCPKCHTALAAIDYEGVRVEACPTCGGDFLDAGQLGAIVEARKGRFDEKECAAIAQAAKITGVKMYALNRHLTCPKCGGTTNPENYGDDTGMIIDKCAKCGGVWLEGGELKKIEELVEGWDEGVPADVATYAPKLDAAMATEKQFERVNTHHRFVDAMINGVLNVIGE